MSPLPALLSRELYILDLPAHFKAASSLLQKRIMGKFVKRKSKGKKNPKGDGLTGSTQWLCLMSFVSCTRASKCNCSKVV